MEKGLYANKEIDLLFAGKLELDKKSNTIVMRKPNLVIGSDRLELYEFFGRRREVYGLYNRNWLKFCVGITAIHFMIVEVPTIFSSYFGDEVSDVSTKLGSKDHSEIAKQMQAMKQRKEL